MTKMIGRVRPDAGTMGGSTAPSTMAGRTFADANFSVRPIDGDATALGLLGNDLLKRFNLILDNQQGARCTSLAQPPRGRPVAQSRPLGGSCPGCRGPARRRRGDLARQPLIRFGTGNLPIRRQHYREQTGVNWKPKS